ncbi:MAG: hypothetical protein WKG32_04480 [Gemmatimonadaceae bacterium]
MSPFSPQRFALFRIALGSYLATHFALLVPYAPELFGRTGMLPDPVLDPTRQIFPNLLDVLGSPLGTRVFTVTAAALAVALAAGVARPLVCGLLWYAWACMLNRNLFIVNPGIAFVGWLLLASAIVPRGEPRLPWRSAEAEWRVPPVLYVGAWVVMAGGYTLSGIDKLASPSWVDGSAFRYVLENPIARDTWLREWLLSLPAMWLRLLTWGGLAMEILFAPLCLGSRTRVLAWLGAVGMHLVLMMTAAFTDLTLGVLMIHLFTLDERWLTKEAWGSFRRPPGSPSHTRLSPATAPDPPMLGAPLL